MKKADERDIIFSRLTYKKGSEPYIEYYARNPEKQETDDAFRERPVMGGEDTAMYHALLSPLPDACFGFLSDIKSFSTGEISQKQVEASPEAFTKLIKGLAMYYNAKLVGVTALKPEHYYSHKGRPEAVYGREIEETYRFAIAFAVEMEQDMIFCAPALPESVAVTKGYIDAAVIGMVLSYYIRALGYEARNNMDGNYEVVAPYVAQDAGLGEIGRMGLLITKQYGPRVRLGVVSTNMPLVADSRANFGIAEFCAQCSRCAKSCPGKALPYGDKLDESGAWQWGTEPNRCFAMWQKLGTDCGVCLASCPFSSKLPAELIENITTKETRDALHRYCDTMLPQRPFKKVGPDWMQ